MMDNDAKQQYWMDSLAVHQTLLGLSDGPGRFRRDPMMALINQAHQARIGQDEPRCYMTMPF